MGNHLVSHPTPPQEIDKVKARLKRAEEEYQAWKRKKP